MILDFACKNVYSFAEGIDVSFRKGDDIIHLLGVKGANGSGKTNLLRALSFMMKFASNSFSLKPEEETGLVPFYDSMDTSYFRTSFFFNFDSKKTEYIYELFLNKREVIQESIYRKVEREQLLVERKGNAITKVINEFAAVKNIKLRSNVSIISMAHQYELTEMDTIYKHCSWVATNVESVGLMTYFLDCNSDAYGKERLSSLAAVYHKETEKFKFVKKFICSCDIGISDIVIQKEPSTTGEDIFIPYFLHQNGGKTHRLPYKAESSGTQFLFIYLNILQLGTLGFPILFDELDMSLHPHIVPKILELFDPQKYPDCGQLVFTTHNTGVMDTLDKAELFLLNKDDNESFGYRADELPSALVRKDRPLSKPYDQGKLGGVPKI